MIAIPLIAAFLVALAYFFAAFDEPKGRHQPRVHVQPSARTRTGTGPVPDPAPGPVPLILAGTRGHIRIDGHGDDTRITTVRRPVNGRNLGTQPRRQPWYVTIDGQPRSHGQPWNTAPMPAVRAPETEPVRQAPVVTDGRLVPGYITEHEAAQYRGWGA
jgi:hypothetical protein